MVPVTTARKGCTQYRGIICLPLTAMLEWTPLTHQEFGALLRSAQGRTSWHREKKFLNTLRYPKGGDHNDASPSSHLKSNNLTGNTEERKWCRRNSRCGSSNSARTTTNPKKWSTWRYGWMPSTHSKRWQGTFGNFALYQRHTQLKKKKSKQQRKNFH